MGSSKSQTDTRKRAHITALEKTLGIVTQACKISGVSRSQHYEWVNTDSNYKDAVSMVEEMAIDFAESKLHKNIEKGKETSIIFYLKTKAKKRGYVERKEIDAPVDNTPFRSEVTPIAFGDDEEDE